MSLRTTLLIATALLLPSLPDPAVAVAAPATNGKFINTDALNGKFINGKFINGKFINTALLETTTVGGEASIAPSKPGFALWGTHVAGSGLAGWAMHDTFGMAGPVSGTFYEGTDLSAKVIDSAGGAPELVTLRIDHIEAAEADSDVLLHWVSVHTYDDQQRPVVYPLCQDDANRVFPAIVLRGEWSQDEGVSWGGDQINDSAYRVTFACVTGALGKCAADCVSDSACAAKNVSVALGYRRWAAPELASLGNGVFRWRDYAMDHQACTRMVRADYCGDGVSWTETGTAIDVYDKTRVNGMWEDPASPDWDYEATWNEDGAVRIQCGRLSGTPVSCGGGVVAVDYDAYPSLTSVTAPPSVCFTDDGMSDPAARLGNLRRELVMTPVFAYPELGASRSWMPGYDRE